MVTSSHETTDLSLHDALPICHFASDAGKKGGEFYTPAEVATLLAKLLEPHKGETICDPACGSGSLLIRVAKEVASPDRSEEHTSELQSLTNLVCRLPLEKTN